MAKRTRILIKSLESKTLEVISKYSMITPGDKILIALSGGADSVFLLYLLVKYKKYFNIELAAIHINHGLRGDSADADEKYSRDICKEFQVEYYSEKVDIKDFAKKNKYSLEEAGRISRYSAFTKKLTEIKFDKIATAHHADDNLESMLLSFVKGCEVDGLRGIAPVLNGNIIRPLLGLDKIDIVESLNAAQIKFCKDETNDDNSFLRNKLRNQVIPLLREINPSITDASMRLADSARIIINTFKSRQDLIAASVHLRGDGLLLRDDFLSAYDRDEKIRVVKNSLQEKHSIKISRKNSEQIVSLLDKRVGTTVDVAKNIVAIRERDGILFESGASYQDEGPCKLTIGGEATAFGKYTFFASKIDIDDVEFSKNGLAEFVDSDKIKGELTVRYWRDGDKFIPIGMKGQKMVSDYLAEKKVLHSKKKDAVLVCCGDEVVWVVTHRLDERYKVEKNSNNILKLRVLIRKL